MGNKIAKNISETKHNQDIDMNENEENKSSTLKNVGIAQGLRESVDRYGSAISEDVVAYSGQRLNADGSSTSYQKSHSKIATHKINTESQDINVAQQAGFNAEVQDVANKNKDAIINKTGERYSRTDDIVNTDGTKRINDQVADIVQVDKFGNVIAGSEGQMKFVKKPNDLCDNIVGMGSKDLSRYQDQELILPPEQVTSTQQYCREQSQKLHEQAEYIKEKNPTLSAQKKEQARQYEKLEKNIVGASLSSDKAKAYRLNPIGETAKSIAGTAHDAGFQGAMYGAAIGGGISIVSNIVAVMQDKKEMGDALIDCTVDTTKAAAMGYGTTFVGSTLKGASEQIYGVLVQSEINKSIVGLGGKVAEKAKDEAIKKIANSTAGKIALKANVLSKTALPALAVTVCLELGGLIHKYSKGEIDGVQFMEQAGERGIGLISSSAMATIGQIAIPIPVVGAVIGGMIGYTLSSMFYNEALSAF